MSKEISVKDQINYLKIADPKLGELFDLYDEMPKLKIKETVYEDLLSSIISQQVSVQSAIAVEKRFKALFTNTNGGSKASAWPDYDTLINTSDEILLSAGLSRQKRSYVKNVAIYFKENNLHDHDFASMSDQEVIEKLVTIKGVGVWTVEMLLIFTLGRENIFSVKDIGLVNGIVKLYGLEKYKPKSSHELELKQKDFEKTILSITEKWSPYKTLASRYVWKYKDGVK